MIAKAVSGNEIAIQGILKYMTFTYQKSVYAPCIVNQAKRIQKW